MLEREYVLQIAAEVLDVLIEMGRITVDQAFTVRDEVASVERHSATEVIAAVVIEALGNLWVDPDEAIHLVSVLAALPKSVALQLLS